MSHFVYGAWLTRRRRIARNTPESPRRAGGPLATTGPFGSAPYVERLAYTRAQAAEALGISTSTFIRRLLPFIDTVEMPWGARG